VDAVNHAASTNIMNTQTNINGQGLAAQRFALDRSAGMKPAFRSTPTHLPPLGHCLLKTRASAVRCGVIFLIAAFVGLSSPASTQAFDCGSTGAYGPMNITSSTNLQLRPDGIFNCTTITIAQGATLTFSNNSLNTPVYLLATGDVTINGIINVSGAGPNGAVGGQGGPGGFDGGNGGTQLAGVNKGGYGLGPGRGPCASYATLPSVSIVGQGYTSPTNQTTYGNTLADPLIGGSGGDGSDGSPGGGGGGGGGAVLIASNTRITVAGNVTANGASSAYAIFGLGSGGAIRLVGPVISGTGSLTAKGGEYHVFQSGDSIAGTGRIRIDCTDNQAYRSLTLNGVSSRGSRMIVFSNLALDITAVGGQPVTTGTNSAVVIELAVGASTNQTVTVQARNFTNDVPIRVVVTPENGPRGEFDATILQSSGNPPSANVPVIIPAGSACQINAWTR